MITVLSISIMKPLIDKEDQIHIINNIFYYWFSFNKSKKKALFTNLKIFLARDFLNFFARKY
jgi:hypothetical protein